MLDEYHRNRQILTAFGPWCYFMQKEIHFKATDLLRAVKETRDRMRASKIPRRYITTTDLNKVQDADIRGSFAALKRAARDARRLAVQTNTPLYVWRDGRIVNAIASPRIKRIRRP